MKRTIKFRAKSFGNEKWIYGSLTGLCSIKLIVINEDTVCQYTGLKDKHGTEIYEDDILKIGAYPFEGVYVVKWDDISKCIKFMADGELYLTPTDFPIESYEVIGNIYDNPDLLRRKIMHEAQLQLVTYKQALRLKKAGFNWPTTHFFVDVQEGKHTAFAFWDITNSVSYGKYPQNWNGLTIGGERGNTSAPTVSLALKWLRDVKGIDGIYLHPEDGVYTKSTGFLKPNATKFRTYEEAESSLLDEILNIMEYKQSINTIK